MGLNCSAISMKRKLRVSKSLRALIQAFLYGLTPRAIPKPVLECLLIGVKVAALDILFQGATEFCKRPKPFFTFK